MAEQKPVDEMSFEEALEELRAIVTRLERGESKLDEALSSYERGAALRARCEKHLSEAKERIEQISIGPDGSANTAPFDPQS